MLDLNISPNVGADEASLGGNPGCRIYLYTFTSVEIPFDLTWIHTFITYEKINSQVEKNIQSGNDLPFDLLALAETAINWGRVYVPYHQHLGCRTYSDR